MEYTHVSHLLVYTPAGTTITAVLYAPLGPVPCTRELHTALQQAVGQKGITYSVRPLLSAGCKVGIFKARGASMCPGWNPVSIIFPLVLMYSISCMTAVLPVPSAPPHPPGTCAIQVGACTRLGSEGPLLLPGWGVEAVLKNTEYSAMDEVGAD
jgi:hypothetical protein